NPSSYSQASFTVQNSPPSVLLSAAPADPTNASPIVVTATFSQPVTGLDLSATDLQLTNATASSLVPAAGPATSYTFNLTPSAPGQVTAMILAGAVVDASTNQPNTASNTFSRTVAGPPTFTGSTPSSPT